MMMKLFFAAGAAGVALCAAAAAKTCALDDPDFAPPSNDSSAPADDIILMSIGLDGDGEFVVSSAKRGNGLPDYAWQLDDMLGDLTPHDAGDDENATPFDLVVDRDTMIIFKLTPGAWKWEADPAKALFLKKTRRDSAAQPHNPFSVVEDVPGRPRMMAVRFHAPTELSGCGFDYNLGVVVKQGGRKTPLVIDPRIQNGGGGQN